MMNPEIETRRLATACEGAEHRPKGVSGEESHPRLCCCQPRLWEQKDHVQNGVGETSLCTDVATPY